MSSWIVPLPVITMRKSIHAWVSFSLYGYGAPLAAGAPLVIPVISFSSIFVGLKIGENFLGTFRESLILRSRRKIVFAGNLISRN